MGLLCVNVQNSANNLTIYSTWKRCLLDWLLTTWSPVHALNRYWCPSLFLCKTSHNLSLLHPVPGAVSCTVPPVSGWAQEHDCVVPDKAPSFLLSSHPSKHIQNTMHVLSVTWANQTHRACHSGGRGIVYLHKQMKNIKGWLVIKM